jgi:WXG100 family type VII secretion target
MPYLKVTSEELQHVGAQLDKAAAELELIHKRAMSHIMGLVGAGWEGAASATFSESMSAWTESAARSAESMSRLAKLLAGAGSAYAQAEEQIRQSMAE